MENINEIKEKLSILLGDFFVEHKLTADDAHHLLGSMQAVLFKDAVRSIYMKEQIAIAEARKQEQEKIQAELYIPPSVIQEH